MAERDDLPERETSAALTATQLARVDELLATLMDADEAGRAAALARESDPMVRAEVRSHLDWLDREGHDPAPVGGAAELVEQAVETAIPDRVASYVIDSEISAGGMGVVYLAEQTEPKRPVALKVIRPGMASPATLRRFRYEAQTLARLNHVNIAKVYEAGTHDDGRGGVPFFAMEYVPDARTLTEYAREKDLGTRERLDLFGRVCDAVHYGHLQGVIHRDLKPSNILVGVDGEPKVIDFGVARAIDPDSTMTTARTDVGQLIGTLQYMSPEQCRANPDEIDTRCDVYALGVVLYELLCDQPPYDVREKLVHEAVRIICEDDPVRPSTVDRRLRGDLETIALKAIEKEGGRRYQSAHDLKQDVERYLEDRPIEARPPSAGYQLAKFARRNRALVTAASVSALALLIATIASAVSAVHAGRQETAATNAKNDLEVANGELETLNDQLADEVAAKESARAEEARQRRAADRVVAVQAGMLDMLEPRHFGESLAHFLVEGAGTSMQTRRMSLEELDQFEAGVTKINHTDVARSLIEQRIFAPTVRAIAEDLVGEPEAQTVLQASLAHRYRQFGFHRPSLVLALAALRAARLAYDEHDTRALDALVQVARSRWGLGYTDRAEADFRTAIGIASALNGRAHSSVAELKGELAMSLTEVGRHAEAAPLMVENLEMCRRVSGENGIPTLESKRDLGRIYVTLGRLDDAERLLTEAVDGLRAHAGEEARATLRAEVAWGDFLGARGQFAEAREALESARAGLNATLGHDHEATAEADLSLAVLMEAENGRRGDWSLLHTVWRRYATAFGPNAPRARAVDELLEKWYPRNPPAVGDGHPRTHEVPAQYPTIQAAIDAASPEDVVEVAPGVYAERIVLNSPISVVSTDGPEATVLDGSELDGSVVTFGQRTDARTSLRGFSIVNGTGSVIIQNSRAGGGLFMEHASGRIVDCVFEGNSATYGGGAWVMSGSATFEDCLFRANTAGMVGGGLHCDRESTVRIVRCTFERNRSEIDGGGAQAFSNKVVTFEDCRFVDNTSARGGGYDAGVGGSSSLIRCTFERNTATHSGGGVSARGAALDLAECVLTENVAAVTGGGVLVSDESIAEVTATSFTNNQSRFGDGGGLGLGDGVAVLVDDASFDGNTVQRGARHVAIAPTSIAEIGNSRFEDGPQAGVSGPWIDLGDNEQKD